MKKQIETINTEEAIAIVKAESPFAGGSPQTLWDAARKGEIEGCVKVSGEWRYPPDEVRKWCQNYWLHRRGRRSNDYNRR